MLALEIEFLTGRYRATSYRDREASEWPPHPSRIFSALVAAHFEAALGTEAQAALEWLEEQPAPEIAASDAVLRELGVHFVPVNDDSLPPEFRNRQPRSFPTMWPSSPLVHLSWPSAEPTSAIRSALDELASFTTYLGHSSSLVRFTFLNDHKNAVSHIPDERGSINLRVPKPGRLQTLIERFDQGQDVDAGPFERYTKVSPNAELEPVESTFGEMLVVRCVEGRSVPISAAIHLTGILRDAVLNKAGDSAPPILHGHGDSPHIAYIPLPFVGGQYADGHVMGLAAVLPRGLSRSDRRIAMTAIGEIVELTLGSLGEWKIEPVPQPARAATLDPETWIRASKVWATVTPIVFDRFPRERDGRRAGEIIAESCRCIGLPVPSHVEFRDQSKFTGVPPVREFRIRRRESDPPRPATHAVLHFEVPVSGPVILGAGRFFGLGLCRPWK